MMERQKLIETTMLADEAQDKGDLDRAEVLYTKAIIIADKLYGSNSISVCSLMLSLTRVYEKRGDYARASLLLSRIKDLVEAPHSTVSSIATANSAQSQSSVAI